ncbi:MAG: ABC transporter permease subunit [Nitrososphaeria archaeon]|nr:ABC transporter permease subunit [Nitrososphaeria archaeon]NIQ33053.1 ABC transporter permease subunit [Nitrososphaeria archaeon]
MELTKDVLFKIVMGSCLCFLLLFFVLVVASVATYTSLDALLSSLISDEILFSIQLSVFTATITTILSLVVAVPAAYTLSRTKFLGKGLVDMILNIPIVTPPVALGAALLIFFNTPIGAGTRDIFVFELPGIILAQFMVVSALAVRVVKSTFDDIDPIYENVARTLGYNKFRAFFSVVLPLSKNGLLAAAVLAWARALGEFGATVTLAGATRMKTETLSIAIYLSLATADVVKAAAVILILVVLAVSTFLVIQWITRRGVLI